MAELNEGDLGANELDDDGEESFTIKGIVKWFDPTKGYGFIIADDDRGDVLLHSTCLKAVSYTHLTLPTILLV